jgi:hypothetical protein
MKQFKKSAIAFGVFAAAAFVTLGTSIFSSTFAQTQTSTGVVEVTVDDTLTISLSDSNVYLDANAAANDGFAQGSTNVTIGTNNVTGASLTVRMDSTTPSNNLLGTGTNTAVIAPTASPVLAANTWGYEAFNTNGGSASGLWNAMPANTSSPDVIFSDLDTGAGMNAPGSATWTFNFGTVIDFALPADTYSGTILYTATTN